MNLEGLTSEDAKKVFAQRLCSIVQILIFLIAMIVIGNIIFLGYNEKKSSGKVRNKSESDHKTCLFKNKTSHHSFDNPLGVRRRSGTNMT